MSIDDQTASDPSVPQARGDQISIRVAVLRGGTSKGVFFHAGDLPGDAAQRDRVVSRVMGSPDPRQIDGLGGSDLLTSKVAIIGPSERPDADVDYLFGQVNVETPEIDWSGNCGNISAGVGPFAIDEGLVAPREPITEVRIYNVNTDRILTARVQVADGVAVTRGSAVINGVPGSGSPIELDYGQCIGGATGVLLPLGGATADVLTDDGPLAVTLVDAGNLTGFVRARDLDLPAEMAWAQMADPALLARLDRIRAAIAVQAGIAPSMPEYLERPRLLPQLALVGPAAESASQCDDQVFAAREMDFVARLFVIGTFHRTFPITGLTAASVAARLEGSVVWSCILPEDRDSWAVRIGHPCGIATARVSVDASQEPPVVEEIVIERTARRIMDGRTLVPSALGWEAGP